MKIFYTYDNKLKVDPFDILFLKLLLFKADRLVID